MLFGATFACPRCAIRFAHRDTCPSCSGRVVSLSNSDGRRAIHGRRHAGAVGGFFAGLSAWAPTNPWIPGCVGIAMMVPALVSLMLDPSSLLVLWLVDDRTDGSVRLYTEREGLSAHGFEILAAGAAGLLLTTFVLVATSTARKGSKQSGRSLSVFASSKEPESPSTRVSFTGLATRATVELESPLGLSPCLAFGLRGTVDGATVDDADGGDFDLVQDDGRRIMVSLEHAVLKPSPDDSAPVTLTNEDAVNLERFLLPRVGARVKTTCTLTETRIAEGDRVTVTGIDRGEALGIAPFRDVPRGRVIVGTVDAPLVVRKVSA